MSGCIKLNKTKYVFRNSPPYSANKCKSKKKKGNDGKLYISEPDKNGIYKWVIINKNKTIKKLSNINNINNITKEDLLTLVKKYQVTKSGTNQEIAERLIKHRGHYIIKNKTDKKIVEHFLKKITPSSKRLGFIPNK